MAVFGTVQNGEVKLDGPSPFPDGTKVRIETVAADWVTDEMRLFAAGGTDTPTSSFAERMKEHIGAIDDLPPDASLSVDA